MPMKNLRIPASTCATTIWNRLAFGDGGSAELGVTRQAFNNLVNGISGISPEMAIRLSKALPAAARKSGSGCRCATISPGDAEGG